MGIRVQLVNVMGKIYRPSSLVTWPWSHWLTLIVSPYTAAELIFAPPAKVYSQLTFGGEG